MLWDTLGGFEVTLGCSGRALGVPWCLWECFEVTLGVFKD